MKPQPKLLMFGYLPPPAFGPSVAYQTLLRSAFTKQFEITFIDLTVVRDIRDLERFHPAKLLKLLNFALVECYHLLRTRFDFCCYPVSYNRNAFLKDALLLGLARLFRVPVVLYAHGRGLPAFRLSLSPRLRRLVESTTRSATAAIVVAEDIRAEFDGILPAESVFVVAYGIESLTHVPAMPHGERDGFTVLYVGALYRPKGVFELIQAVAILRGQRPDARLVLVGRWSDAAEEAEAHALIARLHLDESVVFTGPLTGEDKWRAYAEADVFAFLSSPDYEAFGIVLLEALHTGLPIVTNRGGARSEIVTDGVNGFVVDAGDVTAVADRLRQLASDPDLRERMGAVNREKLAGYYTHEHYGRRMGAVFAKLSGNREEQIR